jgi:hypothetical protein
VGRNLLPAALVEAPEEVSRGGLEVDDELVLTGQELVGLLHPLEEGGVHEIGAGSGAEERGGVEVDELVLEVVLGVNGGGRGGQQCGGTVGWEHGEATRLLLPPEVEVDEGSERMSRTGCCALRLEERCVCPGSRRRTSR